MDQLIDLVVERTGISREQAEKAVETVVHLARIWEERAP